MDEEWRELQVGDHIRLVSMPPEWDHPRARVPADTRRLVARLVKRGRSLRVSKVDECGAPWVECRFRLPNGRWEYHSLTITQGGWVRVRVRR